MGIFPSKNTPLSILDMVIIKWTVGYRLLHIFSENFLLMLCVFFSSD